MNSANILISSKHRRPRFAYIAGLLLAVILVGLWFFYTKYVPRQVAQQEDAAQQAAQSTFAVPAAPAPMPAPMPQPVPALPPAAEGGEPAGPAAGAPAQPTAPDVAASQQEAAAAGMATLKFNVREDSWISVQDADGKEIFNKIKHAGDEDEVQGKPPLSMVIGNAGATQVYHNGQLVDLAPHTRANVARMTLE